MSFASFVSDTKLEEVDDAFSMSSEGEFVDFDEVLNLKKDDKVRQPQKASLVAPLY